MAGLREEGGREGRERERRLGRPGFAGPRARARPAGPSEGEKRGSRPVMMRFCFFFQKCEIVIVFLYFSEIFVKLQKY
jgi:hypothetical protein